MIGFGVVRDNPWHITLSDDDPAVRELLDARFGPGTRPVTYAADRFLAAEFAARVRAAPGVYLRRVARTLVGQITAGAYAGGFYQLVVPSDRDAPARYEELRARLAHEPLPFVCRQPGVAAIVGLQSLSSLIGRVVVFASFVCLPFTIVWAIRRRQVWYACIAAPLVYKTAMVTLLAWADARFTSPMYAFHVLNLITFVGVMRRGALPGGRGADCAR